ncbi:MAG: hypothetical protein ACTHLR_00015 [Rhizomicrobium sp.]
MEQPLHAASDVDKDETVPRIVAVVAGLALIIIVTGGLMYSGIWSPAPTQQQQTAAMAKH